MTKHNFNWKAGSFFIIHHALLFATLPWYLTNHPPGAALLLGTLAIVVMTGVALTVLYHRCYSHRALELHWAAEISLLALCTLIAQGTAWEWVSDHRRHHRFTETDRDPHAITRGFWYAHIGWIFHRRPTTLEDISDLRASRLLQLQHHHYKKLLFLVTAASVGALGLISGDWLGALYMGLLMRLFVSHHCTFCINSLAHCWGSKPFDRTQTAVNNYLCSLLTFGEGEHNYHHVFPHDYRIGDRWHHWDPGKWLVWSLSKTGLAHKLKRASPSAIVRIRQRNTTATG